MHGVITFGMKKNLFKVFAVVVIVIGIPIGISWSRGLRAFDGATLYTTSVDVTHWNVAIGIWIAFALVSLCLWHLNDLLLGKNGKIFQRIKVIAILVLVGGIISGLLIGFRRSGEGWFIGHTSVNKMEHSIEWVVVALVWVLFIALSATLWLMSKRIYEKRNDSSMKYSIKKLEITFVSLTLITGIFLMIYSRGVLSDLIPPAMWEAKERITIFRIGVLLAVIQMVLSALFIVAKNKKMMIVSHIIVAVSIIAMLVIGHSLSTRHSGSNVPGLLSDVFETHFSFLVTFDFQSILLSCLAASVMVLGVVMLFRNRKTKTVGLKEEEIGDGDKEN